MSSLDKQIDFTEHSCREFIDVLASSAPIPGGGGASALVGAIGVALGNMVGSLTVGKKRYADVEEDIIRCKKEADEITKRLLELVAKDAEVFEPLSKAYSLPKSTPEELAKKEETDVYRCTQLYGIGGSIRSAAKLYGDLCNKGNRFNYLLPEHIDAILNRYAEDTNAFAHEALRTLPDRIHTLIPGCVIIREAFKLCDGERLDICKYGVREGYLAERVLVKPVSFA